MKHHKFGVQSEAKLLALHSDVAAAVRLGLEWSPYDFTIVHTWRGEELQNGLFDSNASTKRWPKSWHNTVDDDGNPYSYAVDFAPWVNGEIPWGETHIFAAIAGAIMAAANYLGEPLEWGGDWDSDGSTDDQTLMDWGHLQRKPR